MAEDCKAAFGRYLRTLRERRGLSLEDVESLSRAFPEPVAKAYLSRCENGRMRIAFSKIIALSRVYEVPAEVLVERMELDLELDRIGGPETEGLSYEELHLLGKEACIQGHFWRGYGYFRDAVKSARNNGAQEGGVRALLSLTIAVARLGRHRLALHELDFARATGKLSQPNVAVALALMAQQHRALGRLDTARDFAEAAVHQAESVGIPLCLAYAYLDVAVVYYLEKRYDEAISLWKKCFPLFRKEQVHHEAARVLTNLAQAYYDTGRLKTARRALISANRLAEKHHLQRTQAWVRLLLGEIARDTGQPQKARELWREAIDISRRLRDHVTRFKAEFQLFKHLRESGDDTADSIERLLRRHGTWVPKTLQELLEFKSMTRSRSSGDRVSVTQHP